MDTEVFKRKITPAEFIKTYFYKQNANKWILQRIKNIDIETYNVVKNRLKELKYEFLINFGTIAGRYDPNNNKIGIFGKGNITQSTILHETLHACSNNEYRFSPYNKNDATLGLMARYNTFMANKNYNCFLQVDYAHALNESATEFFTYDILRSLNKEYKPESIYNSLVNIFAIFCSRYKDDKISINEDIKNTIFSFYIKSDFHSFVDYLSEVYNTPKSQINLLIFQLDEVLELKDEPLLSYDMLIRCCNTIYEMQFNRFKYKYKNATLDSFLESPEIKEITNLLPDVKFCSASKIAKGMFIKKFKNLQNDQEDTNYLGDFIMNNCFDKKRNFFDMKANWYTDSIFLNNADIYNSNYQENIKNFNDYEKLSLLLFYSSFSYLYRENDEKKLMTSVLKNIITEGMPENENLKKDFMFYIINLPSLKKQECFKNLPFDEIIDYVKDDKSRYKINLKSICETTSLKNYLKMSKDYYNIINEEKYEKCLIEDLEKTK